MVALFSLPSSLDIAAVYKHPYEVIIVCDCKRVSNTECYDCVVGLLSLMAKLTTGIARDSDLLLLIPNNRLKLQFRVFMHSQRNLHVT